MTPREHLYQRIKRSDLSATEQKELVAFVQFTGEDQLPSLIRFFDGEEGGVRFFYNHVKEKYEAARGRSIGAFKNILDKEREFLKKLAAENTNADL